MGHAFGQGGPGRSITQRDTVTKYGCRTSRRLAGLAGERTACKRSVEGSSHTNRCQPRDPVQRTGEKAIGMTEVAHVLIAQMSSTGSKARVNRRSLDEAVIPAALPPDPANSRRLARASVSDPRATNPTDRRNISIVRFACHHVHRARSESQGRIVPPTSETPLLILDSSRSTDSPHGS